MVDALVVQSMPEHVEIAETIPQERISEHTQTVNVPQIAVPVPFHKETDEVILPVTAERTSVRTVEQFVDMSVPQIQEQIVEVANTFLQERISERVIEQAHDVPVPQIHEQLVEFAEITPQRRTPERIVVTSNSRTNCGSCQRLSPGAHFGTYRRTDGRCDNASNSGRDS